MCGGRSVFWGVMLVALGSVYLASNLGYLPVHWHRLWPAWLIVAGVALLVARGEGRRREIGHE